MRMGHLERPCRSSSRCDLVFQVCNRRYNSNVIIVGMTPFGPAGLGTLLRHLIDLLDREVEAQYRRAGLAYRPRYTPVVRTLNALGSASIRTIARHAQLTHSAVSQTVAQMARAGLVRVAPGADARERIVRLSSRALAMQPELERIWRATRRAQLSLERELAFPLSALLQQAIDALEREPFGPRIAAAGGGAGRARRETHQKRGRRTAAPRRK